MIRVAPYVIYQLPIYAIRLSGLSQWKCGKVFGFTTASTKNPKNDDILLYV